MKCDRDIPQRFRHALGKYKDYEGEEHDIWKPHVLIPYVLGGPTLHLKLAVLAFLIGLFYELWRAANDAMLTWHGEHLKVCCPFISGRQKTLAHECSRLDRLRRDARGRIRRHQLHLLHLDTRPPIHPYPQQAVKGNIHLPPRPHATRRRT